MLYFNLPILQDDKIVFEMFSINLSEDNKVIIGENISNKKISCYVPLFDKCNGYTKILLRFPFELKIYQEQYIYSIVTGEISFFQDKFTNFQYDFFFNLQKELNNFYSSIENKKVNLKYFNSQSLLSFPKVILQNYISMLNQDIILNEDISIEIIFDYVYNYYTILKNLSIILLYQYSNEKCNFNNFLKSKIPIKLIPIIKKFYEFKFDFNGCKDKSVLKYVSNGENKSVEFKYINVNDSYFIKKKNSENNFYTKFFLVNVTDIKNNKLIEINKTKELYHNDYSWYIFSPELKFEKNLIFTKFIESLNNIDQLKKNNYFEIFNLNEGFERLLPIILEDSNIYPRINILKKFDIKKFKMNNYFITDIYNEKKVLEVKLDNFLFVETIDIEYIINDIKNKDTLDQLLIYFEAYFKKIIYPIKFNRKNLDINFEKLLYLSLLFIDRLLDTNNSKYFLKPEIINIIPIKMKNFYVNILKYLSQMVCDTKINNFLYNNKFYQDTIYQTCLKIILTNKESFLHKKILLLLGNNSQIMNELLIKWEKCFLLKNIADVLEWKNIKSYLPYLNFLLENNKFIFYNGRLNRSIFKTNINENLKTVISCPFKMYQYLNNLEDFIKWTIFLGNKYVGLYTISVSFSSEDIKLLGTLIYYLYNIENQSYTDPFYEKLINLSKKHNKLIIRDSRINLKIKEKLFKLKCNLNLGYLAKHINIHSNSNTKSSISLSENTVDLSDSNNELIVLKTKLKKVTKKYYKYKAKYLKNRTNYSKNKPKHLFNKI